MSYTVNAFTAAVPFVMILFFINPLNAFAQEKFDSTALGFGLPDITVSPTSGPPGTQITIKVENMPPPPKGNDPRIEFFVYLPFVSAIGTNIPNNCDGEHCFPLYSFDEINQDKVAPKTITLTLFSKQNPKAITLGGEVESICDLKVNGERIERYGPVCNTVDQPTGEFDIKFAWGIQRSDKFDVRKTVAFTVTQGQMQPMQKAMNPDDIILEQYKNGEITEQEFEKQLSKLGYDADAIRKAKALLGRLPHQEGAYSPEQKQQIEEGIKKMEAQKEQSGQTTKTEEGQTTAQQQKGGGCLIATAAYGTEIAPQVQLLREIRDDVIFGTNSGTTFMTGFNQFYYSFSPTIADLERLNPTFKEAVKLSLTPMLSTLSILNYVEIDSEQDMLGYGIGIILLNLGIYFVAPAIIVIRVRRFFKI